MRPDQSVSVQSLALPVRGLQQPVHLVQLTDLHFGLATPLSRLRAAVEQANALSPDVVVLTGDVASWFRGSVRSVRQTLGALNAPRVAVLGNHDHHVGASCVGDALRDAGFLVLSNASARVGLLTFVGVDDPVTGHDDAALAMEGVCGTETLVGLVHDPRAAPALWARGVPLVLAGHTHGGHFDVGRWPERVLGSPFVGGLYPTAEGTVYVCPGIGSATFRWRYGQRSVPAIGSLTLTGSQTSHPVR